eukprot:g5856.t1
MFARGFKSFCNGVRRHTSSSGSSTATARNSGYRNVSGPKNSGFGGPTGYATYRTRTDEIIVKDFGKSVRRTSRSTQAMENRMLMRAVRPTASILVQAAAEKALAIVMAEEDDDGTYVKLQCTLCITKYIQHYVLTNIFYCLDS